MITDREPRALQSDSGIEGIDTASLQQIVDIDSASLQKIVTAIAAAQKTLRSERSRTGLVAARQRGQRLGRPPAMTATQIALARRMMAEGVTRKIIARTLKVSRSTLYIALKARPAASNPKHPSSGRAPPQRSNKPSPKTKSAPPLLAALLLLFLAFPAAAQTAGGASANLLTGENNVALGQGTLQYIQGGTNGNTAVGVHALNTLTTGTSNTALGYNAGRAITTGTDNTLIGYESGSGVKGSHNIELGEDGGSAITTGSSNILIGNSLSNVTNTSNTQLDIGDLIMGSISGSTPEVGIGTKTYQGQGLTVSGKVWATQFEMTSDARLKTDIRPLVDSLSRIEQVKGVTFEWKSPEARTLGKDMSLPLNQPQMGVLAQDVEAAFPQAVATGPDGLKTVNYESLVAPLIEAVKAQQEEIRRLTPLVEEVGAQQEEIKRLELRLDAQKREIDDLKSRSPRTQAASFHPDSQPSP